MRLLAVDLFIGLAMRAIFRLHLFHEPKKKPALFVARMPADRALVPAKFRHPPLLF